MWQFNAKVVRVCTPVECYHCLLPLLPTRVTMPFKGCQVTLVAVAVAEEVAAVAINCHFYHKLQIKIGTLVNLKSRFIFIARIPSYHFLTIFIFLSYLFTYYGSV